VRERAAEQDGRNRRDFRQRPGGALQDNGPLSCALRVGSRCANLLLAASLRAGVGWFGLSPDTSIGGLGDCRHDSDLPEGMRGIGKRGWRRIARPLRVVTSAARCLAISLWKVSLKTLCDYTVIDRYSGQR